MAQTTCHELFGSVLVIVAFQDHQEDPIALNPVWAALWLVCVAVGADDVVM